VAAYLLTCISALIPTKSKDQRISNANKAFPAPWHPSFIKAVLNASKYHKVHTHTHKHTHTYIHTHTNKHIQTHTHTENGKQYTHGD
jgi:hypothetical protein